MTNNVSPEFEASAGNPTRAGEEEFERVFKFLQAHQQKLAKFQAKFKEGPIFGTDINGTLTHAKWGPWIDRFLSDMHDRGASVGIVSGRVDNDLTNLKIAQKLAGGNLEKLGNSQYTDEPWFLFKPFGLQKTPSFWIDDDSGFQNMLTSMGGTFVLAKEGEANLVILEIWSRMSETQKDIAANMLLGDDFKKPVKPATPQGPQP